MNVENIVLYHKQRLKRIQKDLLTLRTYRDVAKISNEDMYYKTLRKDLKDARKHRLFIKILKGRYYV